MMGITVRGCIDRCWSDDVNYILPLSRLITIDNVSIYSSNTITIDICTENMLLLLLLLKVTYVLKLSERINLS